MKQKIRYSTFETNSSSSHSLILISKQTFEDWKNDKVRLNHYLWHDNVTDNDFVSYDSKQLDGFVNSHSWEEYKKEVIDNAYTEDSFFYLDESDYDDWDRNSYPKEENGIIKIEVYGHDG